MSKWAWVSTPKFSVQVDLDKDNYIVKAAPIVKWSVGKQIGDLLNWCTTKFGHDVAWEIRED